ncbi:MAG TPA: TonB-dependent receptor [Kofleriaceae bacterium]
MLRHALALVAVLGLERFAHADDALGDPADVAGDARDDDAPDDTGGEEIIEIEGRAPREPTQQKLETEVLHTLPGAGNDALRGLQSLPGVARVPFGMGGLALRGAAPHDTRVFLDGIEVPILYHFGGLASFVPIDALEHIELTPSGFGARWGRGIGGLVLLESRSPKPTRWRAQGEVSLLHAGALAVGPGPKNGSWLVGVRRSYVDAVLAAAQVDLSIAPSYLDAQARWESGDKKWLALAVASGDSLTLVRDPNEMTGGGGISTSNVKSFDYTSRFLRLGARYRDRGITITPWFGLDDIDAIANHKGVDKGYKRFDITGAARVEHDRAWLDGTLRTGVELKATHYSYAITNIPPAFPGMPPMNIVVTREGSRAALDAGMFVEQDWLVADKRVTVRPGLRLDYLGLADSVALGPRLSVISRLRDGVVLTQTIGLYHQPPLVTDLDPIYGDRELVAPRSFQVSASAEAPLFDLFDGRATLYAQAQRSLAVDTVSGATPISDQGGGQSGGLLGISRELVDEQFGSYSYREYVGRGHAYGLELFARREIGRVTGWLAYTYARSYRTGDPRRDERYYPYVLDQPHVLTALATLPLGSKWRIGGRLRLASGNPITPVADAYVNADMEWTAVDGPILSERLPYFAQLDLRVDRLWRRRTATWTLYLDIQNVTNRANPEGVTYSDDFSSRSFTRGLPIFPSLGVEYRPSP